ANRITDGKVPFEYLGSKQQGMMQFDINNGNHHLHGGVRGYNSRAWSFDGVVDDSLYFGVKFSLESDMAPPNTPGKLLINVDYLLTKSSNGDRFIVDMHAKSVPESPNGQVSSTLMNMTRHPYWRLEKNSEMKILTNCSRYLV